MVGRDRRQRKRAAGLRLCSIHEHPGRTSLKEHGYQSHSGQPEHKPTSSLHMRGEGHILTPSRSDCLPLCKGTEKYLKILSKDKANSVGK